MHLVFVLVVMALISPELSESDLDFTPLRLAQTLALAIPVVRVVLVQFILQMDYYALKILIPPREAD